LIELLVVIAIIVVLMAVLLAAVQGVRKQARAVACQANLRQWSLAYATYANDHEGKAPGFWWGRWDGSQSLLRSYMRDYNDVYLCPVASRCPTLARDKLDVTREEVFGGTTRAWWERVDGPLSYPNRQLCAQPMGPGLVGAPGGL
jgi:type II secretory pathway pseudopilin PulG